MPVEPLQMIVTAGPVTNQSCSAEREKLNRICKGFVKRVVGGRTLDVAAARYSGRLEHQER